MEKIWLSRYPHGVPAEVDLDAYRSLKDVFERTCERFADLPAYSNMGVSITYRDLERASRDFGAWLQKVAMLKHGDRVAIMMPNLLQYPVALFGALRAGFTVVNVNPQYTARELEHQLNDSGATLVVVVENFAGTLEQVLARTPVRTVITTQVGDLFPAIRRPLVNFVVKRVKKMVPPWHIAGATPFRAVLRAGRRHALDDVALTRDDVAFLQYTGGTTGVAKGAVLTHGNLVANIQQMSAWMARDLTEGRETIVIPLPLYHVYALTSNLVFMKLGARCVLITNPRDLPAFIDELERSRFTAIIGVNTLYGALIDAPAFAQVDVSRLKLISAGGMAVQRVVAQKWKQATGVAIIEGYGLTETSPVVIASPLGIDEWNGTVDLPIPSTEVAILDDDGREMPIGDVGEICVRGPQVMKGYWNRPEETAKVFTPDGWFRTGDMGFMNAQGPFKVTDRKKDMIIVSGFKVFPNEVEDVVSMHPGVLEAACVGVPDEKSGESVRIVVVKKNPGLTAQDLIEHCRKHLTGYKVPRSVVCRTEPLPKTNIGKILRRELRDGVAAPGVVAA